MGNEKKNDNLRLILSIVTILTLFSCGQRSKENEASIEPKARELNDSAVSLYMTFDKDNTLKAIELLDKATEIDSDYFLAHWNKYVFQNELNLKDQAFKTLKTLELLSPENPELIMASGAFHENNGVSSTAIEKYRKANNLYESIMDTINKNGIQYLMLESNRAINLIFLGQEVEGREILKELYNNESDEAIREMIQSFLTLSREDFLDGKMNKK